MGTRNLIMVISDKKTKVAQYSQWDGYPSGQGKTALEFLLNVDLAAFKKRVDELRFANEADSKEVDDFCTSIGVTNGWFTMEQSKKYKEKYYHLSRDAGAMILYAIMNGEIREHDFMTKKEIVYKTDVKFLIDSTDFAANFSCEWGYVIDLDKRTFEVYKSGDRKLGKGQRFYYLQKENEDIPIRMIKSFSLDALPSLDEWDEVFNKDN